MLLLPGLLCMLWPGRESSRAAPGTGDTGGVGRDTALGPERVDVFYNIQHRIKLKTMPYVYSLYSQYILHALYISFKTTKPANVVNILVIKLNCLYSYFYLFQ